MGRTPTGLFGDFGLRDLATAARVEQPQEQKSGGSLLRARVGDPIRSVRGSRLRPAIHRADQVEIHPVYSIDVCEFKTLTTCRVDRQDVWTPLAEWLTPGDSP